MSKRLGLLGAVTGLVLIGLLLACGSNYNPSQDGLLLVGSQGSSVIETFSFTLSNGHVSAIANSPNDTGNLTCLTNGSPSSMVVNPAGTYLFVIYNKSDQCPSATKMGIATFQVSSDGNVKQLGFQSDPNPTSLAMDSAGKFLFVAEGKNSTATAPNAVPCPGTTQYGICVYSIGSSGSLTSIKGNFNFVNGPGFSTPNIVSVASSPTIFPGTGINGTTNSVCQVPNGVAPTSEYLYAVDSTNYVVWEYAVNSSTGALGNPPNTASIPYFVTDQVPAGVAVDPCDRFVYVSDSLTNKISAYTICTAVIAAGPCPNANFSLVQISGSPFVASGSANGLGPIAVDPYGNNVYVVGTLSNTVSGFSISRVSGSLTAFSSPTVATGPGPVSMTIRGDDNWMFVANFGAISQGGSTVSQYSITPATGVLSVLPAIQTDNYPFGVAVK